jgi:hemerythrin-like domain-containing protein
MNTNAITLLKEDHKTVRKLLEELTETTTRAEKTRKQLLAKISQELEIHTRIEEEIFYPALKKAGGSEAAKMFFEAMEEHRAVDDLVLPDLQKTDPSSDKFSGRAKVLMELVEHHADEEEKEMFKKAREAFSSAELKELGEQMGRRKEELKRELRGGGEEQVA